MWNDYKNQNMVIWKKNNNNVLYYSCKKPLYDMRNNQFAIGD